MTFCLHGLALIAPPNIFNRHSHLSALHRPVLAHCSKNVLDDSYLRDPFPQPPSFDSTKPPYPGQAAARAQASRARSDLSEASDRQELLRLLKHTSSLQDLLVISNKHDVAATPELLTTFSSKLSSIATSSLSLKQLAKDDTYQQLLLKLLPFISQHGATLDAAGIATMVLAMGRLRLRDAQLITQLLDSARPKLHLFNARNTSNLLHGLALLQHAPPSDITQELLQHSASQLYMAQPQGFSNSIWALAKLGITPPNSWVQAFLQHSSPQLASFNPQNLANTIWALAKLGIMPPVAWSAAFFASSAQLLPSFKAIDLANMAWALGNLGIRPQREWLQALCTIITARMHSFNSLATCTALYGLARLRHKPDEALLAALLPHLQQHLRSWPANQALDVVRSLAMMAVVPGEELMAAIKGMLDDGRLGQRQAMQLRKSLDIMAMQGANKKRQHQQHQ